jgi:uncharacterized protein with HEPN domain
MTRSVAFRLDDIMSEIKWLQSAFLDKTYDDYLDDRLLRYATERSILIISEASRHIPQELKQKRSEIPWVQIAAVGNILRHEYQHIAASIVFDIVNKRLPDLKSAIAEFQTLGLD